MTGDEHAFGECSAHFLVNSDSVEDARLYVRSWVQGNAARRCHRGTSIRGQSSFCDFLRSGSSLNFYYVTSAKNMDAIANTPSAIAAAISLKPKVHFKLYYTDKDESNVRLPCSMIGTSPLFSQIGARLGVCAMHQYPYPHNLNALSFISCVSTKHIEMRCENGTTIPCLTDHRLQ